MASLPPRLRLPVAIAALAAVFGFPGVQAAAAPDILIFDVFLDQKRIGEHRFEIHRQGAEVSSVHSAAAFDVRVLGIPAYRYRHQDAEQWNSGCLQGLRATTDDNGRKLVVVAQRRGDLFRLEQPAALDVPSGCVLSYAYWDPSRLLQQQRLLNPQTGQMDSVRFEALGEETIESRGVPVRATHQRLLTARFTIDLWYSQQGEWLQLRSTTESKRLLIYRRQR